MKEIMEECLKSIEKPQMSIDDLLFWLCPTLLAYKHLDREADYPSEVENNIRLQRLVDSEHRKTLRRYLGGSIRGFEPYEEKIEVGEVFSEEILGTVGGFPVYAYYVSGPVREPPTNAILISRLVAFCFGVKKAALIVVNRDSLEWSFWSVLSDSDDSAIEVCNDAEYVEGIVRGKAPEEGIEAECIMCPYQMTCTAKEKFVASPYSFDGAVLQAFDMERMVNEYLQSLNKKDDGRNTGFLSPSEICATKCDRKLWYKRKRTKRESNIDPQLRRVFDMGHAVHEVLQKMLHDACPEFKSEVRAIFPRTTIKGRCDGVLGNIGLEIKSISKKGFESVRGPKTTHHRQGTIYGASLELEKMLYVYYNKSTGEVKCVYKDVDEEYAEEIRERVTRVEDMFDRDEAPERVTGWGCRTCPYVSTCKPKL